MAKIVLKHPGADPEIGANVGTAFAFRRPQPVSSPLPEVIKFYHTRKGFYLVKSVCFFCHLNGRTKDYAYLHLYKILNCNKD